MTQALTYVEIDIPDFNSGDDHVKIFLPFDGVDASTSIVDTGPLGSDHVWTANGNAQLDAAVFKFGTASLLCDGTGDSVTTPADPAFALGLDDFTIDCWFNRNGGNGTFRSIAGTSNAAANAGFSFGMDLDTNNVLRIFLSADGTTFPFVLNGITPITATGWHHVAGVRSGNTLMLFLDGAVENSATISGAINTSVEPFGVGGFGALTSINTWNGWIDHFRYRPGIAEWTEAFTPPASENQTYRFAVDALYLPSSIDCIPNIKSVTITPSIVSLGQNLGQRASVAVTFKDHRHIFADEAFDSGTFWGKFRARYGLKLRGFSLRVINGVVGESIDNMETRHYVIEATDGPTSKGEYKINASDILKLADGDRSQCPVMSNGFLLAAITNVATAATLSPTGIGNAEYPASGVVAIGGTEICTFTRAADALTLTRAQFNTVGVAHDAGDRVQLCRNYVTNDPGIIIKDLLVNFAGVDEDFISLTDWTVETSAYLGVQYSALIAEPTSVNKLISELIEQAGLVVWWDDVSQQIRLQVLREISSAAASFDEDNTMANTLDVKEQPEKRVSQCYVYFAKINPLVKEDQLDNYRSTAFAQDEATEAEYGSPSIKKIFSRWIPAGGRAIADQLTNLILGRFINPPRLISFDVLRYSGTTPVLGTGYQIGGWLFQDTSGDPVTVPAQVTRLNPKADVFDVEAEEILFTDISGATPSSPDVKTVIYDSNIQNVNLRTTYDTIYPTPTSGITVNCNILSSVLITSASAANPAFDVGSWPAGVTVNIIMSTGARIQGGGGAGATGSGGATDPGGAGSPGGTALYTRFAINLTSTSAAIWGGGGGGGGGGGSGFVGGGGGGGGAGIVAGAAGVNGGLPGVGDVAPGAGTATTGGAGGISASGADGGAGGGPGVAGTAGQAGSSSAGGAGGAVGAAIDGDSFVTDIGAPGDILGGQIN